jgi:hypothetical protein
MSGGCGLHYFVGLGALGVRQLDRYAGEVPNALMTTDEQVDGVFRSWLGCEGGNLIQHLFLLSQER